MKFDSNQAWKDAAASVAANRDVLFALAGVFLALPALALAIFMPPPQAPDGATPEAALALMGEYYSYAWPVLLVLAVLQLLGTLTMLTLFTDRSRPTVGEAIRQGARAALPVLAAQVIVAFAVAAGVMLVLGAAIASGVAALKLLAGLALIFALAFVFARLSLVSPVVVVDGQRNPVAALRRSWDLTRGNVFHLLAFFVLLLIAALVLYLLINGALGFVVSLLASGETANAIKDLIAACLQAAISVYSVAVIAAIHRQLAGPSAEATARPFE